MIILFSGKIEKETIGMIKKRVEKTSPSDK